MIRVSIPYGKTSGADVTYVANELVTTDAPAGTVGIRIGATTGLTSKAMLLRAASDAVEKLLELVCKQGRDAYQQVSGLPGVGKAGMAVNTNVDLPADPQVGAYVTPGAGLKTSSTSMVGLALRNCLEKLRENLTVG